MLAVPKINKKTFLGCWNTAISSLQIWKIHCGEKNKQTNIFHYKVTHFWIATYNYLSFLSHRINIWYSIVEPKNRYLQSIELNGKGLQYSTCTECSVIWGQTELFLWLLLLGSTVSVGQVERLHFPPCFHPDNREVKAKTADMDTWKRELCLAGGSCKGHGQKEKGQNAAKSERK